MKSKKAQTSIFLILGVIIIGVIILFFVFSEKSKPILEQKTEEENYDYFMKNCLEDNLRKKANYILIHGGYANNSFTKKFQFENEANALEIAYLCYNQNYYSPCINQEPMLINHLKKEIKKEIANNVENCFQEMNKSLEKENYSLSSEYKGFDVLLEKGKIIINISSKMVLNKNKETSILKDPKIIIKSYYYDLGIIAQEIISQEAEYCNFETSGFMLDNPEFDIKVFRTGDLDKIYKIKSKKSKEEFRFAIRGCVIPPGI